ncbi:obscurin-like [Mytilus trossulus]|uniref:obscurin-like n=1 Tax=Mytilus trossulus TaxID=6551 RepID=UPI0030058EEB
MELSLLQLMYISVLTIPNSYFTRTLRNISCYEGDTVNLVCEVTETDTSAQWYKDGANIEINRYIIKQTGKTHQLTIACASPNDNGLFKVDINSRVREASLKVKACFIKDIKRISCIEGEHVNFSCDVHQENAVLRWFKGNKEIKSSDKYVVQSHNRRHKLEIKNVNIGDSGEITVKVKNCTRTSTLEVRKCFNQHLQSQQVIEGYSVQFECELSCPDDVGVWYKDDLKIESSNKSIITKSGKQNRLVVKNTSLDDKGEYSFKVQNISTKATLIVEDYFEINPLNTTCKEGDTVHLTCEAIENSLPAQWRKDGLDIDTNGGKFSKHQTQNASQLIIRSVNQMDSGCYSVDISGRIRNAYVTVTDYFIKPLKDIECREGETAEFRCKSIESPSTVEWSKNGNLIDHNRCIKKQVKHTNKLRIQYAQPGDSGCYRISVNARTSEAFLKVKDYFTMSFNDITCKEGETARFKCVAIENGMVVKWYKDNKEIQSDKYIVEQKGQVYQLTINNGDPMDTGYYSIRVNGRTRTAFLMIEGKLL